MDNHWLRETIQKIQKKFKKVEVPHVKTIGETANLCSKTIIRSALTLEQKFTP